MSKKTEEAIENPEKLATLGTQYTKRRHPPPRKPQHALDTTMRKQTHKTQLHIINVKEYRRTIQRNWENRVHNKK